MSVDILTASEAAALAKCSSATIFHAVRSGVLPAGRFGRSLVIQQADIQRWQKQRTPQQKSTKRKQS